MPRLRSKTREEGIEYLRKNNAHLYVGKLWDYEFCAAALRFSGESRADAHYRLAYAFRSKKDPFNWRYAIGMLGNRISNTRAQRYFTLPISQPGNVNQGTLASVIWAGIQAHSLNGSSRIPEKVRRAFKSGIVPAGYVNHTTIAHMQWVEQTVLPQYANSQHSKLREALYGCDRNNAESPDNLVRMPYN